MKASALIRMSIKDAQAAKWAHGREKHGEAWAGEHPLFEGYSEVVDLLNYLDESIKREPRAHILWTLREDARLLAERLQLAASSLPL